MLLSFFTPLKILQCTLLSPDVIVDTTVMGFSVGCKYSAMPYCCWSSHIVSERQYHVIILHDNDWNNKYLKDDDIQKQNHFLHGLIHRNGFGHLLCINGIEGGSKKIIVEDVSKKKSMDLRLLNKVAYGHPWFGRLESLVEVIVNVLLEKTTKKVGRGGMCQMEVRETARKQIGDTGLLDYVLKSMNNVIVGDHIVRRVVNPSIGYYNTQFMSLVMVKNLKPLSLELMLAEWPFKDEQDRDECVAEDDDGERMVGSYIGEVWQHTRRHGI
ncbi:hypothetical protein Pint_30243 [Pistacia integerrima]|uniref:Uncharacterized protein n=1 Tax=Pistacia integerrima TaxID=434235 RepID=A0ACC0WZY8_9ROSI|nr:hypothetical protein Pint_30243 [Pistacia integerrima]